MSECNCVGVLELDSNNICKKCGNVKIIPENPQVPGEKKIFEVDYGIASSYEEGIEINRKIVGELREEILRHERSHRNGKYSVEDMKVDFQSKKPHFFKSLKFAIFNPESLIGYFPLMYSYYFKILTYNSTATLPFVYFGVLFSIFFLVLFKINFFLSFLGWSCFVVIVNIILLITTHRYVKKCGTTY